MTIINDLTSPIRPYLLIAKIVGLALLGLALVLLIVSWWDRGRQIEMLTAPIEGGVFPSPNEGNVKCDV